MSQYSDERGSELRALFFETAQELLQSLNEDSLKLERNPQDREIIRSIRRTVHTLKGDSAAAGFHELSELAHTLEDALAVETPNANVSLAEIGFTAADTFGAMLVAYRQDTPLRTATLSGFWYSNSHPVRVQATAKHPKYRTIPPMSYGLSTNVWPHRIPVPMARRSSM